MEEFSVQKTNDVEGPKKVGLQKGVTGKIIEILKKYHKMDDLKKIMAEVRIPNYDIYQMAEVNQSAPVVLNALFGDKYESADADDIKEVIEAICVHIVEKKDFDDFVLSVGMGGSINVPNIRMPGYILPAIKCLDRFHALMKAGKIKGCPRLKVFKADNMASFVNGFDIARVSSVSKLSFEFLVSFIEEYYPHLKDYIVFTEDKPVTEEEKEYFGKQATFLKNIPSIEEEVQNVVRMGEKHAQQKDNPSGALLYAAAHPFYNQSIINPQIKPLKVTEKPSVVVDFGGRPQMRFNKISRELMKLVQAGGTENVTTPTIHVIIKPGKIPVYYTARDGDIPLGSPISSIDYSKIDTATHADYKEIFSSIDEHEFINFVARFNQEHKESIDKL